VALRLVMLWDRADRSASCAKRLKTDVACLLRLCFSFLLPSLGLVASRVVLLGALQCIALG
jgi:hypothetical protein